MKRTCLAAILFFISVMMHGQHKTDALDALFAQQYNSNGPGAAVVIWQRGKIIFKKDYGEANTATHTAIGADTHFNIGSLTKQFTAFCIVELAAEKRLSLNDPVIQYLPSLPKQFYGIITIRQLLTHSSGIEDHYALTDTSQVKHATDKEVLQAMEHATLTYFTPGTSYRYSNTAYCLLALVIEKVSGMRYYDYVRTHIFEPLKMTHATVLRIGKPITAQAYGYNYDSANTSYQLLDANQAIFFSTEGDGGIYLSTSDYIKWWKFLQRPPADQRVIVDQIRSPQRTIDTANKLSYGFGWFVSEKDTPPAVYHTGSNGGFRAIVFTIPANDYMVTIFSNRTGVDLEQLVQQVNTTLGVTNNSFTKIERLVSFIPTSPIFAPCKETRWFSTLSARNWSVSAME